MTQIFADELMRQELVHPVHPVKTPPQNRQPSLVLGLPSCS